MSSLRSIRPRVQLPSPESSCLEAFDRELDYVFRTLQRLGARPDELEDLLQEIFVVLYRNWPTLDTTRPLRPWLFGVAFRVVRGSRRRRARETLEDGLDPQDGALSPESLVENQESLALLWEALERVPPQRRSVLVLHDLEGVAVADIARQLSITRVGAYARLTKARKELAAAVRRLRKEGVQP